VGEAISVETDESRAPRDPCDQEGVIRVGLKVPRGAGPRRRIAGWSSAGDPERGNQVTLNRRNHIGGAVGEARRSTKRTGWWGGEVGQGDVRLTEGKIVQKARREKAECPGLIRDTAMLGRFRSPQGVGQATARSTAEGGGCGVSA